MFRSDREEAGTKPLAWEGELELLRGRRFFFRGRFMDANA